MPNDDEREGGSPPKLAGRFERLVEINRGGIGRIEVAFDPAIRRRVAVKTLRPDLSEDERASLKFSEEAQITGQLEHPNIVPIYDLCEDEDESFIVMKLIRGKTLAELLSEAPAAPRGAEGLQRFVQILLRLCDALSYAHSRGVIHCDLKPDNVMVGDYGEVYLMDWGVAFLTSRRQGAESSEESSLVSVPTAHADTTVVRGTPAYMAPEHLGRSDEIDERTDVFGLGGILYEILTGNPPNDWDRLIDMRPGVFSMPSSSRLWSRLPPGLCRIALKALAPAREDRYSSIELLKADLEQYLQGGGWFETKAFSAGQSIVVEGEPGDAAYIIEQGHCNVIKTVQGESVLLRTLGPGDVFGETAVLTGAPRTASVLAVDDVILKVITGESLNQELDRNPWVAAFVRSLAALFREVDALAREPRSAKPAQ